MNFPFVHIAGDTLDFTVTVPEYLSSAGWTLKYRLTPRFASPTQAAFTIAAIANSDGSYQVQASPATTASWIPGAYGWARWVEKTGARQTLASSDDQGEVEIRPDPSTSTQGLDTRSFARQRLEQVETAILAFTDPTVKSYSIGTRSLIRADVPNLIQERDRLRWEVANENAAAGIAAGQDNPRNVGVRFSRV